jgi:hypothetical protein
MQPDIAGADQARLHREQDHPGAAQQAMDDELGIAVARLTHIGDEIVGETDQGQQKQQHARDREIIEAQEPGRPMLSAIWPRLHDVPPNPE